MIRVIIGERLTWKVVDVAEIVELTSSVIGERAFAEAFEVGRSMFLDDAVALALSVELRPTVLGPEDPS